MKRAVLLLLAMGRRNERRRRLPRQRRKEHGGAGTHRPEIKSAGRRDEEVLDRTPGVRSSLRCFFYVMKIHNAAEVPSAALCRDR